MSKVYTLQATHANGGKQSSWTSNHWTRYISAVNGQEGNLVVGRDENSLYRAVYFLFDKDTLAVLRTKPIVSITLSIKTRDISGETINANTTYYQIGYKLTDGTHTASTVSDAWVRGNADSTAAASTTIAYVRGAKGSVLNIDVGTTVPVYGYSIGTAEANAQSRISFDTSYGATLTVVTDEVDAHIKVGGAWKMSEVFIKINGAWTKSTKPFVKSGGVWKSS